MTDSVDSVRLAHDLDGVQWRSQDVSIARYLNQTEQIEISTPSLAICRNEKTDSEINESFLMKSADNSTFSSIKINVKIVEDLKRCGFVRPSPIQAIAIPLGRIGIDLIAQSKSGTGKTIVFVVCTLEMIVHTLNETACPRVLIVAPTREIAVQIGDTVDLLTSTWNNFSCYKAIGGTKVSENLATLSTSQVVVGTPGRICCLLENDFLKTYSIRLFVLDECDKLMDENFQIQVNKIFNCLPVNKQMIVTSATLSDNMATYLTNYMRSPALVRLNSDQPALIGVMQFSVTAPGHSLDYLNFESKIEPLLYILKNVYFTQCFLFCNYQTRVKYLFDRLFSEGYKTAYISGDMTQKERLKIIKAFRQHQFRILVSTDLTSRGIDIDTVNLVINVDVPFEHETYLHRIGRAGRFGSAGIAITIIGMGVESKRFHQFITQFNFEVKELTLPIKLNLWDLFYREQLDPTKMSSLNFQNEALQLNSKFNDLMNQFKTIKEIYSSNDISLNFPVINQTNYGSLQKFISDPSSAQLGFYENLSQIYLEEKLDNQISKDIKDLKENHSTDFISPLSCKEVDSKDYETNSFIDQDNSHEQAPLEEDCLIKQDEMADSGASLHCVQNSNVSNLLQNFKRFFLNPQLGADICHINRSKVNLCKYMLKGGKL